MQWKRARLTIWESNGYRITEDAGPPIGDVYRLDMPDGTHDDFPTLEKAKAQADLLNELALYREDNARLRAELDTKNGVWPAPLVDDDKAAAEAFEALTADDLDFGEPLEAGREATSDDRGIPTHA